jgi:hypothetical protein
MVTLFDNPVRKLSGLAAHRSRRKVRLCIGFIACPPGELFADDTGFPQCEAGHLAIPAGAYIRRREARIRPSPVGQATAIANSAVKPSRRPSTPRYRRRVFS